MYLHKLQEVNVELDRRPALVRGCVITFSKKDLKITGVDHSLVCHVALL